MAESASPNDTAALSHNPGVPAGYGRTCSNCSRAKTRCVYMRQDSALCERCHRLNKQCQPAVPVRRRAAPKKPVVSRTSQLENKLDDIVTLLRSSQTQVHGLSAWAPDVTGGQSRSTDSAIPRDCTPPEAAGPRGSSLAVPESVPALEIEPGPQEAEDCLHTFRQVNLKYFPFAYFPATMTAEDLRRDRPIFWLVVMAVALRMPSRQALLVEKVKSTVAQKVIVENERSLDGLCALLALIGWAQYARQVQPFLSVYAQLATAITFELGLARVPTQKLSIMHYFKLARDGQDPCTGRYPAQVEPQPVTMQERRAALACYLITSMLSITFKKIDALRWTSRMDEHLSVLSEHPEHPGDTVLTIQVKLQQIMEQINQADWQPPASFQTPSLNHSLTPLYLHGLRLQLDRIRGSIPADLREHEALQGPLHVTELIISEATISVQNPSPSVANFDRLENLNRCAKTIASFFDFFFSIPSGDYLSFPFHHYSYLAHHFMSLYALSILQDPAWDRQMMQKTVNILDILDRLAQKVLAIPQNSRLVMDHSTSDMFSKFSKAMTVLRSTWEVELISPNPKSLQEIFLPAQVHSAESIPGSIAAMTMGMSDEAWFGDIFVPWDDGPFRY